ncbi:hypothetical protein K4F52_008623 [Lecanicillium sp. MT-2017a]|nr:hypothetical protein K4F52_008623 [Lecanicillium sp. MT-2017a]
MRFNAGLVAALHILYTADLAAAGPLVGISKLADYGEPAESTPRPIFETLTESSPAIPSSFLSELPKQMNSEISSVPLPITEGISTPAADPSKVPPEISPSSAPEAPTTVPGDAPQPTTQDGQTQETSNLATLPDPSTVPTLTSAVSTTRPLTEAQSSGATDDFTPTPETSTTSQPLEVLPPITKTLNTGSSSGSTASSTPQDTTSEPTSTEKLESTTTVDTITTPLDSTATATSTFDLESSTALTTNNPSGEAPTNITGDPLPESTTDTLDTPTNVISTTAATDSSTSSVTSEPTTEVAQSSAIQTSENSSEPTSILSSTTTPDSTSTNTPAESQISPTGTPDAQIPTVSHIGLPTQTSTVPENIYADNLASAKFMNDVFSGLSPNSACNPGQIACVGDAQGNCNKNGLYDLLPCTDGKKCFALPLQNYNGIIVGCQDPKNAEAVLGGSQSPGGEKSEPAPAPTETETEALTTTIHTLITVTRTVQPIPPSPPAEDTSTKAVDPIKTTQVAKPTVPVPVPGGTLTFTQSIKFPGAPEPTETPAVPLIPTTSSTSTYSVPTKLVLEPIPKPPGRDGSSNGAAGAEAASGARTTDVVNGTPTVSVYFTVTQTETVTTRQTVTLIVPAE